MILQVLFIRFYFIVDLTKVFLNYVVQAPSDSEASCPHCSIDKLEIRQLQQIKQQRSALMEIGDRQQSRRMSKIRENIIRYKEKMSQLPGQNILIMKSYKKTCSWLRYVLKIMGYNRQNFDIIGEEVFNCLKAIKTVVHSSEPEKYGHTFALFAHIVFVYQTKTNQTIPLNKQQLMKRLHSKESRPIANQIQNFPISSNDLKFKTSQSLQNFFTNPNNHPKILQNPRCLCCTQIFHSSIPVCNYNPIIPVYVGLGFSKFVESLTLSKYLNAICNRGGGVVLIGARKRQGAVFAVGIRFRDQEEALGNQGEICKAFLGVVPECYYQVERIPVLDEQQSMAHGIHLKICFRVSFFPKVSGRISYLETIQKGYQGSYDIYFLDNNLQPQKLQQFKHLYDKIHKKYKMSHSQANSHSNIACFRPHPCSFAAKGPQINLQVSLAEPIIKEEVKFDDDPEFDHKHASLLAVSSKKEQRQLEKLEWLLKKEKKPAKLSKPFFNSLNINSRSIWLLSHEMTTPELKEQIAAYISDSKLKNDTICVMPVHRNLQIQREKLSEYNEELIRKRFAQRYEKPYKTQTATIIKQGQVPVNIFYFKFSDYSQAIFTYLLCQQVGLRPYFVKEIFGEKSKKKKGH